MKDDLIIIYDSVLLCCKLDFAVDLHYFYYGFVRSSNFNEMLAIKLIAKNQKRLLSELLLNAKDQYVLIVNIKSEFWLFYEIISYFPSTQHR